MKSIYFLSLLSLITFSTHSQDSTALKSLQVEMIRAGLTINELQKEVADLNYRNHKYSQLNNTAGAFYFAGMALVLVNVANKSENNDLIWVGSGSMFIGTSMLFFTANKLVKKEARREARSRLKRNPSAPFYRRHY